MSEGERCIPFAFNCSVPFQAMMGATPKEIGYVWDAGIKNLHK